MQAAALVSPQDAVALARGHGTDALAGNVFSVYGASLADAGTLPCIAALPLADAMLRLAPALLAAGLAVAPEQARPVYIRDKVAQTTAERAAGKLAAPSA